MSTSGSIIQDLDSVRRLSPKGGEYWMARDIQGLFGYGASWDNFNNVISKAIMACEGAGISPNGHFYKTMKMIEVGKGAMREIGAAPVNYS